jgi:hypothetical protein
MTRTTVIARQINKYDKIISDDRNISDVELAIFKLAICQLVDAVFSGGGGGGASAATIASGIDTSVDVADILSKLTSIDTKTIDQAGITAAIQAAADIDTIIARLTSLDTNKLTQSGVEAAIQAAADIDTIITRLTTIATNTAGGGGGGGAVEISSYARSTVTVGDSGQTVLAANASRLGAILINRSTTETIDIFLGGVSIFGNGLPLQPGQSYQIDTTNFYKGSITAIAPSGRSAVLAIAEGL